MFGMDRFFSIRLMVLVLFVHRTHEFGFNLLTFVKNWSLRGSTAFPMPKTFLDTTSLISKEGYGWETYPVETKDGYQLQVTRILPRTPHTERRPPIMLVHGLLVTSESWVTRGRNQDLAFLLTEMGFDVWLPDLRGNHYGKRHKYLSPRNPRFWDFSFHESGIYDLPAFIDLILEKNGARQVAYVGHSMGTTVFFVMTSLRPQYNNKISAAVLLAPVASKFPFDEIANPAMRILLTQFNVLFETMKSAGIYELLPRTPRLVYNVKKYCGQQPEQDYCFDIIGQLYGEHRANLDRKRFGEQISHIPAGASLNTVHHFAQVFNYGFHLYDYGMKLNKVKYNSTIPPAYPLERITAPSFLLYGTNDPLTSAQGVAFLRDMIPGVRKAIAVPDYKFTHADFVLGVNTNETVYNSLFSFLMEHVTK